MTTEPDRAKSPTDSRLPRPLFLGLLGLLLLWGALSHWLGQQVHLPFTLSANAQSQLVVARSDVPALRGHMNKPIAQISTPELRLSTPGADLALHSARWIPQVADRLRFEQQHLLLNRLVSSASTPAATQALTLHFSDGSEVKVSPQRPGLTGLSGAYYTRALMALALGVATFAWLSFSAPQARQALALLTACQALIATLDALLAGAAPLLPPTLLALDLPLRQTAELCMVGALLQLSAQHLPAQAALRRHCWMAWPMLGLLAWALAVDKLPLPWWWIQAGIGATSMAALLIQWSAQRTQPHPWLILYTRFSLPAVLMWPLLTWALSDIPPWPAEARKLRDLIPPLWTAGMSVLFICLPWMSRSQRVAREVMLWSALAVGGAALALAWSLWQLPLSGAFTLPGLMIVWVLGLVARWWLINRVFERRPVKVAQLFDELYRAIRTADRQPHNGNAALQALLKNLFQPLSLEVVAQAQSRSLILGDGTHLLVPTPDLQRPHWSQAQPSETVLALQGSQGGSRLFTLEDARLADLIVEQIRRGVLFEKAVEQGRNEERLRLAQDLHDDIGARLLTLMYQSSTPAMEEYVRHTLKDLKTLTRGLAASNHKLSFACAEWKADLTHRLSEANCQLQWSASWDQDPALSVVQWSALTRILRELISNAIAHAHASLVSVELSLQQGALNLRVTDNGNGSQPELWTHGLGLGGIRKRVKQLAGSVHWQTAPEGGIQCSIHVPHLGTERLPLDMTRP